jgi:tetratricopeptide (TPR) repeat protein
MRHTRTRQRAREEFERRSEAALDLLLDDPRAAAKALSDLRRWLLHHDERSMAAACLFLIVSAHQVADDIIREEQVARRLRREKPSFGSFRVHADVLWRQGRYRAAAEAFRRALRFSPKPIEAASYARVRASLDRCLRREPAPPLRKRAVTIS